MKACLFVGLGGAVGSVLRYLIGLLSIGGGNGFPFKTLLINIIGSFVIGIVAAVAAKHSGISQNIILFLKVGICGGFTTFSSFALETSGLLQSGKIPAAILYVLASIILSVAAVFAAQSIIR